MLKKLPFILIITIIASIILAPAIPLTAKQIIFAISLTIKSLVVFLLPFIIFGLLFKTFVKLAQNALNIIILIFGTLICSNFINTFATHYLGEIVFHSDLTFSTDTLQIIPLIPYFNFEIPSLIKNDYALFGGMLSGWILSVSNRTLALRLSKIFDLWVRKLFTIISILIPLFIIGFIFKCAAEGILIGILKSYSQILAIFVGYASVYTLGFYWMASGFSFSSCWKSLKNMAPAFLTALGTISSALTMPVTIICTEKNVKNKDLADTVIPATVNIHLLGDCIAIPLLAYALIKHYGLAEPTLMEYIKFTCYFVIAKFSVAAVPAGGVIIMVPILEKYLHFSAEMSTLLITIYVIFDPLVTGFNVLGNGALAKIIDKLDFKFNKGLKSTIKQCKS